MTLDEYRRRKGITVAALADEIGIGGRHRVRTVQRYLRHERTPALPVLKRIIAATDGNVTLADFPDRAPATVGVEHDQ